MRIDGKVAIITGGNSGIGKETAIDLARRGGKIYLACRDIIKCEKARDEIVNITENANVHFLRVDLASLTSIREFSRQFHLLENKLHILINNAGVISNTKTYTMDGFESHMGVNHLGN
jgi:NAD(P)-dependent dehydrogenase (short-subunit alcohol dehydrogenase family)